MNWWQITLLVSALVAVDLAVVGAIFSMCGAALRPLREAFPPVEPLPSAVRRRYQSFGFDLMNFGMCVHVAADERWLHLRPARFARWAGLRDMSIPWEAITLRKVKGGTAVAEVRGTRVRGPAWCLRLAGPAAVDRP